MQHHPFTEYWPLLDGENFSKFKADIAANGLKLPILTYQDQILDGRNRERACEETSVSARYEDCGARSDEEALALVVSLNEHRRHLSDDQRVFATSRLAELENGSNQYRPKIMGLSKERPTSKTIITLEKAAQLMNVSLGSVARARAILKYGTKEDEQDVISGRVSLTKKEEEVRSRNNRVHRSKIQTIEKMVSVHVLIEELHPIFAGVMNQGKVHQARVSQTLLVMLASKGQQLLDSWASDDPSVRRLRGRVVPFKQSVRKG